jgi:hypothetical protein
LGRLEAEDFFELGAIYPEVEALAGGKEICQVVRRLLSISVRFPHLRPLTAPSCLWGYVRRVAQVVKGFGCRPVVTYPRVLRAGVRKPPGKEPAVGGTGGGRLWRFDGGAARASDALRD